jgi:hypothetical protein
VPVSASGVSLLPLFSEARTMGVKARQYVSVVSLLLLGWMPIAMTAWAQQPASPAGAQQPSATQVELQQLRGDLQRIEARIDALERAEKAGQPAAPGATSVPPTTAAAAPATAVASEAAKPDTAAAAGPEAVKLAADSGMDTMDAGMGGEVINIPHLPQMKIRGFADVQFAVANQNLAVITNSPGSMPPAMRTAEQK